MDDGIRGSCLCGSVAFEIRGPYRGFQYCHCSRCRKKTGATNVANIFVPVDQFEWIRGEDLTKRYDLPNAKYWSTAFCTECGSAVPWKSRTGKAMLVGAGSLYDDPADDARSEDGLEPPEEKGRRALEFGRPARVAHLGRFGACCGRRR